MEGVKQTVFSERLMRFLGKGKSIFMIRPFIPRWIFSSVIFLLKTSPQTFQIIHVTSGLSQVTFQLRGQTLACDEPQGAAGPLGALASRENSIKGKWQDLYNGIKFSVSLHSYRYAWAERSANAGYPERYAQRALGQNSKIVHRAYARKAQGQLPSLEDYENVMRSGQIMVLKSETGSPVILQARN